MRIRMIASSLCFMVAIALSAASGNAQSASLSGPVRLLPFEMALTDSWALSNAPPGGCGCFSLNGADLQMSWPVDRKGFALVADFAVVNQPSALSQGNSLTLGTLLVGARYRPTKTDHRWQPFAEVLAGGGHASGKLIASNSVAGGAVLNFAGEAGGGLDLRLSRRWLWRAAEVDYLATTVNNGSTNHQNMVRVNTGVALRF